MGHKCKVCFQSCPRFSPKLVASGCKFPDDLKCPICDTVHEGKTGLTTEEYKRQLAEKKK